jgi:hypothetical protein
MKRRGLSQGEIIGVISAAALFVLMFCDWFTASVSGGGEMNVSSASSNAWGVLDVIPLILVLTLLSVLAVAVLRLINVRFDPPFPVHLLVAGLGAASVLLILYRVIDPPGGRGFGVFTPPADGFGHYSVSVSPALGIFLSLLAAAGIAFGGCRALREEGVVLSSASSSRSSS